MVERKIPKDLDCGMAMIMEIIGGKWKPCLIYNIWKGYNRPSQLQRLNPKASRRVLYQQLMELEEYGIVTRIIYPVAPPKVEYCLTELGNSLLPVINLMENWGTQYLKKPGKRPALEIPS
ncbi:helix-turn-helix transcriptional regulator [Chitinophaga pendula]|uniref:winged helix-turn-helix transcriptional regulator n=1 Tax=Chitinophaga TaxID=79328 RepID=UPI000BAE6C80|nr:MULTISPECIES: helix-turn-helix domain-containing protein [Chitinophaga]ASZ15063.1 transcriptional regulator [Chitinophaga sp. MD30]UCJ08878.1 helix-turn-helix transcriptional regulator [Chitinophaga pendula]